MGSTKKLIEEDWERASLQEQMYLQEVQHEIEMEYQQWLEIQTAKIITEHDTEKLLQHSGEGNGFEHDLPATILVRGSGTGAIDGTSESGELASHSEKERKNN